MDADIGKSLSQMQKKIIPLPFNYYYLQFLLIATIGLIDSIYLAISHYRIHTDLTYSSFCAVSRTFNCDTVSTSPYAVFLNVPVAVWGVLGYCVFLFFLTMAGRQTDGKPRLWPFLFWLALIYSLGSMLLAGVSSILIHSYCIMCILSYTVNFLLLYYAWFVNRRFGDKGLGSGFIRDLSFLYQARKIVLPAISVILITSSVLVIGMPAYWDIQTPSPDQSVPTGVTEDGFPWIGAEKPELTIVEFSDYMCFQCRKMHYLLRSLIEHQPDKIRLVHRQFPMDKKFNPLVVDRFHSGSGNMSIIAIYANFKGEFWKVSDALFEIASTKQDFNTRIISDVMGVPVGEISAAVKNKRLRMMLKHDIAVGLEYGLEGTPGFLIDGRMYLGTIPKHVLEKVLPE